MRIIEFSIKNPVFTAIVFLALMALGWNAFQLLPRSEDPNIRVATYSIVVVYPGASPTDMEQLVVDPIEDELNELDDVKEIKSTIQDGVSVTFIEFDAGQDPDDKYEEVLRQLSTVRPDLPSSLQSLEVKRVNTNETNIYQAALVSATAPYSELEKLAEELQDRLERENGVLGADIYGLPEQQIRVRLNLPRLAELGISPLRVVQALEGESVNVPGGSVLIGERRMTVKTSGSIETLERVRQTVVAGGPTAYVRVADVAEVSQETEDIVNHVRFDGKRAVFLAVKQKEGQNIFKTQAAVDAVITQFAKELPETVTLQEGFRQAKNVDHRLQGLSRDFLLAILLVLITLLPLGLRASVLVMISIPLSLLMGLALLYYTGFGINQLSIVGLVIALGLLVDDSIVVVENISRYLREGYKPLEAALQATNQIAVAVLGTTATLIFAFIPLTQLPGTAGDFIQSLPRAVIYAILASLLVSLTAIPFLASRILRSTDNPEGNWFMRGLHRGIERSYRPVLHWALAHPKLTLLGAVLLFSGSLALVPAIGFSLFPKADIPMFLVTVEANEGAPLAETNQAVRFVEQSLLGHPTVDHVMANIGTGNPRIYYNVNPFNDIENVGEVFVTLKNYDPKTTPQLIDSLRGSYRLYPGAKIRVREFENGPPIDAPIALRIVGPNQDSLRVFSSKLAALMATTPGTRDVEDPLREQKTDLRVAIQSDRATGMFGVSSAEIDQMVRLVLAGTPAGSLRTPESDDYVIRVTSPYTDKPSSGAFDEVYLSNSAGKQVQLRQLATLQLETSPRLITHYQRERSATVTAYTQSGYNTDAVTKAVLAKLASWQLPQGYRIVPAGEIESRQDSFGGLSTAILIAVFGIFGVLVLEFRTLRSTLIVLSVVPLGVIGGMTALFLSGYTLSFTAVIGFIALIGIEIKNSLLLVDFTNQLRKKGVGLTEAIEKAGEIRFLPILLTSLTAIGGLIPLALENAALYSPLAYVIIGGLISSTLLTRLVTPVMYQLLAPKIE